MRNRSRPTRNLVALLLVLACTLPVGALSPSPASAVSEATGSPQLKELKPMPVVADPADGSTFNYTQSGWLILDTRNRYAYQVYEGGVSTIVQSFDLNTLRPVRRQRFVGIPITSGVGDVMGPGGTRGAGEIVHAVDEANGRLYLALGEWSLRGQARAEAVSNTPDGQRGMARVVMIDEARFNRGDSVFAASFREPAAHARFHDFNVLNMTISRPGRLLVTFAQPGIRGTSENAPLSAHTLARWDVSRLTPAAGHESQTEERALPLDTVATGSAPAEERLLEPCARSSMSAWGGNTEGQLQWEALVTPEAVFTACQATQNSGIVVEVPLGADGSLISPVPVKAHALGKPIADVLVDPGGRRLLLRTVETGSGNTGSTVWVFDATRRRYTGAVALKQASATLNSMGVDPTTGRLYTLIPDHATLDARGSVPVRGGLQMTDTRLDPAPPLQNVLPDMAYLGVFRIMVDPATRRIFVRRGHGSVTGQTVFPCTSPCAPAPTEPFYRVFEDRVPITEPPAPTDDSVFTTDVAESELTRASFQADGSAYGVRSLLVGGLDAASGGITRDQGPDKCGKENRELLAGAVRSLSMSDVLMTAEAASLDADGRTQGHFADPAKKCAHGSAPSNEALAFDEPGAGGRTGVNHYAATCLGDPDKAVTARPRGFPNQPKRGRESFTAEVTCDRPADTVRGSATGLVSPTVSSGATAAGDPVQVAYSHSTVSLSRPDSGGVEVVIDSIARGIDIAGVGRIAVVRTEATSRAAGRPGRAGGTFKRTICGVELTGSVRIAGCLEGSQQQMFVDALNSALGSRGRARLRDPEPAMLAGSPSGYGAGVQRKADDVFEDRYVTNDLSPAVPGLELMFFQGDGDSRWGTGRQIVQLAGAQASTSYGITCLYGRFGGRCAEAGEDTGEATSTVEYVEVPGESTTETITLEGERVQVAVPGKARESKIRTILNAPVRALKEAMRLLFNNPRELGLMAAVWALLYAPCYLGERRRSISGLRARRATATA